jgi:protease-4
MNTIGINLEQVATGPLKAQPEIDAPMSEEVRQSLQTLVDDAFGWFVDVVAERRGLARDRVVELADGRVITGAMAFELGLIDAIGGRQEAHQWLEEAREVPADLKILTYYPPAPDLVDKVLGMAGTSAARTLGLTGAPFAPLDGLVSVWHPQS